MSACIVVHGSRFSEFKQLYDSTLICGCAHLAGYPIGNLANNADDAVVLLGIGYSGEAQQRVKVTLDPRKEPISCLRSAIAVGDAATLSGDILRTIGLITANSNSSIVDSQFTTVIDKRMIKVLSWYDNEWGYSCRVRDLIKYIVAQGL